MDVLVHLWYYGIILLKYFIYYDTLYKTMKMIVKKKKTLLYLYKIIWKTNNIF